MAGPSWPAEATFEGRAVLRGVACDRWREDRGSVVADIFTDAGSGAPVEVQVRPASAMGDRATPSPLWPPCAPPPTAPPTVTRDRDRMAFRRTGAAAMRPQVFSREGGGTTGSDLTPDITFSVWDYAEGPPAQKHFDVSTLMQGGRGACQRQPNDIGFPYTHFWHHYYRA
uniref:Uncharacterized protein n=1 Tax=Tetraselmis sp. GSL018 TaxID=582737 RepID=A0A061S8X5_9CHLO